MQLQHGCYTDQKTQAYIPEIHGSPCSNQYWIWNGGIRSGWLSFEYVYYVLLISIEGQQSTADCELGGGKAWNEGPVYKHMIQCNILSCVFWNNGISPARKNAHKYPNVAKFLSCLCQAAHVHACILYVYMCSVTIVLLFILSLLLKCYLLSLSLCVFHVDLEQAMAQQIKIRFYSVCMLLLQRWHEQQYHKKKIPSGKRWWHGLLHVYYYMQLTTVDYSCGRMWTVQYTL